MFSFVNFGLNGLFCATTIGHFFTYLSFCPIKCLWNQLLSSHSEQELLLQAEAEFDKNFGDLDSVSCCCSHANVWPRRHVSSEFAAPHLQKKWWCGFSVSQRSNAMNKRPAKLSVSSTLCPVGNVETKTSMCPCRRHFSAFTFYRIFFFLILFYQVTIFCWTLKKNKTKKLVQLVFLHMNFLTFYSRTCATTYSFKHLTFCLFCFFSGTCLSSLPSVSAMTSLTLSSLQRHFSFS